MDTLREKKELNNLRLFVIDKINKDKKFSNEYYQVGKSLLDFLVGNELAMQSKINDAVGRT